MEIYYYIRINRFIHKECLAIYISKVVMWRDNSLKTDSTMAVLKNCMHLKKECKAHIYNVYQIELTDRDSKEYVYCIEYRVGSLERKYVLVEDIGFFQD